MTRTKRLQPTKVSRHSDAFRPFCGWFLALTVVVLVSLCPPNAGAEVYKWVDDNGRVHYGDSPPPEQRVQSIKTPPPPPEAEVLRSRSRLDELTEHQRLDHEQEAKRQKEGADAARERLVRESRCRNAKRELHVLELERPVYHLDDQGSRVFLEDDQRAKEIGRAREQIREHCRRR